MRHHGRGYLPRWSGLGWHRHESTDDIADVDDHFRVDVHQCQSVSRSSVMVLRR